MPVRTGTGRRQRQPGSSMWMTSPHSSRFGKMFLENSGDFAVTTIEKTPDALLLLEQETFDAIISDYQMPVMDGIQFLAEVR